MNIDNRIEDGWIVLGDSPVLGITFDETRLDEMAVDKPAPDAGPSPWRRRRGAGLYGVLADEPEEIDEA